MLKHFVIIRLGLGNYHEPWYNSRLGLFEAVTYPSLRAQTNHNFTALVVVDRQIPGPALARLRDIIAGASNFHVVPIDLTSLRHVRHGCWDFVWDRCQECLLEQSVVTDPFEYVVTSILDDDDGWHRQTIETVGRQFEPELQRLIDIEPKGLTNYRHTRGMVLTFPRGMKWFAHTDVVQPFEYEFLGTSIFVLARFSSGISALSSRHPAWPAMAHIAVFEVKKVYQDRPMWVYVRHDQAEMNWQDPTEEGAQQPADGGIHGAVGDPGCAAALRSEFGIDFDKMSNWRASRAGAPSDRHGGLLMREQVDCFFRVTALNRQIDVLEDKQRRGDCSEQDAFLLLKQRSARIELVNRLKRQGSDLFM
jgi:Putative rhamnosyl transferase